MYYNIFWSWLAQFYPRTHQLRVHCAAIGHPILSDDIYGIDGDGSPNAGFTEKEMNQILSYKSKKRSHKQSNSILNHDDGNLYHTSFAIQKSIKNITDTTGLKLCLHARELCIYHPFTGASTVFQSKAPF